MHSRVWCGGQAVAAGWAADVVWGDPERGHPVAAFGSWASIVEHLMYAPRRSAGAAAWGVAVLPVVAVAGGCQWAVRWATSSVADDGRRPRRGVRTGGVRRALVGLGFAGGAAAVWAVLGGTTLYRVGARIDEALLRGDLVAARELMPWLVGRDVSEAGAADLARAVVESLAENTSDAVTAPLLWAVWAGPVAAVAYRAVNTLDAMWGHRSTRFERFGWWAARADDVVNFVPARLTAAGIVAAAPMVGGSACVAWRAWRDDAAAHPSPNAGPVEAATAGALGIRLGGTNRYGDRVEHRGTLGQGRAPQPGDAARAVRLLRWASVVTVGATAAGGIVVGAIASRLGRRCRARGMR